MAGNGKLRENFTYTVTAVYNQVDGKRMMRIVQGAQSQKDGFSVFTPNLPDPESFIVRNLSPQPPSSPSSLSSPALTHQREQVKIIYKQLRKEGNSRQLDQKRLLGMTRQAYREHSLFSEFRGKAAFSEERTMLIMSLLNGGVQYSDNEIMNTVWGNTGSHYRPYLKLCRAVYEKVPA
ncbi:MAG: hypothetical protein E6R03_04310 [Hyphomicrobiaceae bacterium]|nr:MAG: hypothetical protein E6R03_04310 [Hyphomicrobiaceae bacterium]